MSTSLPQLSDNLTAHLIAVADRFTCAVEVATFLAIFNAGGSQQLLLAHERYKPICTHLQSLAQCCADELEFTLLLYMIGTDSSTNSQIEFPQWAKIFLHARLQMLSIPATRDCLLADFVQNRHDKTFRPINFGILERTRFVLAYSLLTNREAFSTNSLIALKPEWKQWLAQEPRSLLAVAQFIAQNCQSTTAQTINKYHLPDRL